jgi:fructosamine-3-kinase
MYANIYQIRSNKFNLDKNNYISTIKQKNKYQDDNRQINGAYSNKRPNSTKYINQPKANQNYMNYDLGKNITSKAKSIINRKNNTVK